MFAKPKANHGQTVANEPTNEVNFPKLYSKYATPRLLHSFTFDINTQVLL